MSHENRVKEALAAFADRKGKRSPEDNKPQPAWYSPKAAELYGTHVWLTEDGKEVEITAVCREYYWPDKVFCGNVTKWIRFGRTGNWEDESFRLPLVFAPNRPTAKEDGEEL